MQLFIDSANIREIEKYSGMKIFSGVTTTPTFFRREGIGDITPEIRKITECIPGELHIEAMGETTEEIIKNSEINAKIGPNVVSKIPLNSESIKAVHYLYEEGIKTNVHLIFSLNQAVMAAMAGATYVCPLIGRLYDVGHDGLKLVDEIITAFHKYPEITSKVMVSSVRTPEHVKQAALLGADITTIPPYVIDLMFHHPLTKIGTQKFEEDIALTKFVRDIMRAGVEIPVVTEETELKDTIIEMTKKRHGIALVVNEPGKLVGVITDGDLRRAIQKFPNIFDLKAKDIMTSNPITIKPDLLAHEALTIMEKFSITDLIAINPQEEPVGIIHIHDIIKHGVSI
jgi:transaldolase